MTSLSDGRQFVINWLSGPTGELLKTRRSPGGWTSEVRAAGGGEAERSTVRFIKSLRAGATELHAVEFATTEGARRRYVVGVTQDPQGNWRLTGAAGGGGIDPPRDRPWVNLGAWGSPSHGFDGGGKVVGVGHEAATRVRLTFKNGVQLEDDVGAGHVLFHSEGAAQLPAQVDVFDARGQVLSGYQWPVG